MDHESVLEFTGAYNLSRTLGGDSLGSFDPACRTWPDGYARAVHTPAGPATVEFTRVGAQALRARLWGSGCAWLAPRLRLLTGLDDTVEFCPSGPLRPLARRHRVRLAQAPTLSDCLVRIVLQQRVAWPEAARSFRILTQVLGRPAPGPLGLTLPPDPKQLARLDPALFSRAQIDPKRAATIREVAWHADRLDRLVDGPLDMARSTLQSLRGCGPWTVELTMGLALADPDAVPTGDYHWPHAVAWALAGEPRADDTRMLELLEPYRGHRFRVLKLLELAGIREPRRGPRLAVPGPPRRRPGEA